MANTHIVIERNFLNRWTLAWLMSLRGRAYIQVSPCMSDVGRVVVCKTNKQVSSLAVYWLQKLHLVSLVLIQSQKICCLDFNLSDIYYLGIYKYIMSLSLAWMLKILPGASSVNCRPGVNGVLRISQATGFHLCWQSESEDTQPWLYFPQVFTL